MIHVQQPGDMDPLCRHEHEQGQGGPGIGQEQGGRHGADDRPANGKPAFDEAEPCDIRFFLLYFTQGGGNVHGNIHNGAGGRNDNRCMEKR